MDRKIYFAGSIRGGRDDADLYHEIIKDLKEKYGSVLTEHVGDTDMTTKGWSEIKTDKEIHDYDVGRLKECGYVVAEVSTPSLGVGYEIGLANSMGKSILCLYRPGGKSCSAMISGAHNGTTFVVETYKQLEDVRNILQAYFSSRQ